MEGEDMSDVSAVPFPTATARVGWTVRERGTGTVLGWIRRANDSHPMYARPGGTYWRIPREGLGDPVNYGTVHEATLAFRR